MALPKRQIKDEEQRKIFGKIFDNLVIQDLFKLKAKGIYDTYGGLLEEGKESRILLVYKDEEPRIIKIYKIEAGNFKNMLRYLEGDERFKKIRERRRDIIYAWCKKEYHNLLIAKKVGISSPEPYDYIHNIIAMEMLGENAPYPQLKDIVLSKPEKVLKNILSQIEILLKKGKLVHGDISEFNILIDSKERPYFIDFGQAVLTSHPFAKEFLKRDIKNLINYFYKEYNIENDADEIYARMCNGVF